MNYTPVLLSALGALLSSCSEPPATQQMEQPAPATPAAQPTPAARSCAEALTALVVHSTFAAPGAADLLPGQLGPGGSLRVGHAGRGHRLR